MSPTRVGIIGAGVAGPVLAIFLKSKGYEPVICERLEGMMDTGIGYGLQQNGLAIINRIPGLLDAIPAYPIDVLSSYSVIPEDKACMGELDGPKRARVAGGLGFRTIRRSDLLRALLAFVADKGIEVWWDHKLETLEQHEDSVAVTFGNGSQETFSFIVGCDGLHSNTRQCLFGTVPAEYTGLCQVGGFAPTPEQFRVKRGAMNAFGDGAHFIGIPVSDDVMGWAITTREPEAKETWKNMDDAAVAEFKKSRFAEWDFGCGELIKNGYDVVKYGLFDRPELKSWHVGRVVLIGDAAHPTSPHLGQGANQSLEDIGRLVDLLEKHNPGAMAPSTATLEAVFGDLERERIPLTAEMVKKARAQGEMRVVSGTEACIKRNNFYREMLQDKELLKRFGA